jgi:Flp pilus assembly pilin Flp
MKIFFNQDGQGLVEYGLLLGLISVVAVGAFAATGTSIKNLHEVYTTSIASALSTST